MRPRADHTDCVLRGAEDSRQRSPSAERCSRINRAVEPPWTSARINHHERAEGIRRRGAQRLPVQSWRHVGCVLDNVRLAGNAGATNRNGAIPQAADRQVP